MFLVLKQTSRKHKNALQMKSLDYFILTHGSGHKHKVHAVFPTSCALCKESTKFPSSHHSGACSLLSKEKKRRKIERVVLKVQSDSSYSTATIS